MCECCGYTPEFSDEEEAATQAPENLGIKEYQIDFATLTAIVGEGLSLTRRPDAISLDYYTSFTFGPIAQGSSIAGPHDRVWKIRHRNGEVLAARANVTETDYDPEVPLFTYSGVIIDELDSAFDQNARVFVCAERATGAEESPEIWFYWYNPFVADFVFENFGAGRTPRTILDNPNDPDNSDVLVFYVNPTTNLIHYRVQREQFATEHTVPVSAVPGISLEDVGLSRGHRASILYSVHDPVAGRYTLNRIYSPLYTIAFSDWMTTGFEFVYAVLATFLINYTTEVESVDTGIEFTSGALTEPLIDQTWFEGEGIDSTIEFVSATLVVILLLHTMYDPESIKPSVQFTSATLVAILIAYSAYDAESLQTNVNLVSATLA